MTIVLIDADSIIYKAGFSNEERLYHVFYKESPAIPFVSVRYMSEVKDIIKDSEDFFFEKEIRIGPVQNALHSAKKIIASIKDSCKCNNITVVLSSPGKTLKHSIAKTAEYKGNRDPEAKPKQYKELREYLEKYYNAISYDGYEADDVINSLAIKYGMGNYIIASIDKDLQLIPGEHYNYSTGELFHVTKEDAEENFWTLMLTGDSADNIKGIPKVGPRTASRLLAPHKYEDIPYYILVMDAYQLAFKDKGKSRYDENYELIKLHNIFNKDNNVGI